MTAAQEFRDKFAIVGLGVAWAGRSMPGRSGRMWQAEATRLAIEDAGLGRADIDGAINGMGAGGSMPGGGGWVDTFPRVLGLPVKFYWTVARGGTGGIIGMLAATQALELGLAKYVVVACGEAGWSRSHNPATRPLRGAGIGNTNYGLDLMGFGAGASAATGHALFASRHMHEYGTTSRQLGAIASQIRQWACINPTATMYGRPITVEDHQNSRLVIEPYHLLDCCLQSDVGMAYVVTTIERARDLKKLPVRVLGIGFGDQARKDWWEKTNYTRLDVEAAKGDAFRLANIELKDIDVAEFYDCFTAEVLFQLEDYGWCKKGEGGPFVEEGHIGPGGDVPVNTSGGLLSDKYLFDYTELAEGILQVRGEAGERQVKDVEVALVTGHGGEMLHPGMCSTHAALILGR